MKYRERKRMQNEEEMEENEENRSNTPGECEQSVSMPGPESRKELKK